MKKNLKFSVSFPLYSAIMVGKFAMKLDILDFRIIGSKRWKPNGSILIIRGKRDAITTLNFTEEC